jgi:predicted nucleic acid-binding protein
LIVLDTNVLSSLMRRDAVAVVLEWLDQQPPESIWTTAITVFEVRYGLEILANGRRRRRLENAFAEALQQDFDGRVLFFDSAAAAAAAAIAAEQRRAGRPVEIRDVQIAGIVAARKATLATRNIRHFEGTGIELVDPWSTGPQ